MKAKRNTQQNGLRKRGRPCLLNASRGKKFFKGIRNGLPLKHAAQLAGVSYDTVNRWKIRGEDEESPAEFRHFCKAVSRAQATAMNRLVGRIQRASRNDWKAAAWLLEKRHPDNFGKTPEPEIKNANQVLPPPVPGDDHPVKQMIAENEEVQNILAKIVLRMAEKGRQIRTRKQWEIEDKIRNRVKKKS